MALSFLPALKAGTLVAGIVIAFPRLWVTTFTFSTVSHFKSTKADKLNLATTLPAYPSYDLPHYPNFGKCQN